MTMFSDSIRRSVVSANTLGKDHPKTLSREKLAADVEAFLASGGEIDRVEFGVLAGRREQPVRRTGNRNGRPRG